MPLTPTRKFGHAMAISAALGGVLQLALPAHASPAALPSSNTRDAATSDAEPAPSGLSLGGWLSAMGGGTMDAGVGLRAGYALSNGLTLSVGGELAGFPPYGTEGDCYYGYDHFECDHRRVSAMAGVGYVLSPRGLSPWFQADAGVAWLTGGSSHVPDETIARFQGTLGVGARYGFEHIGLGLQGTGGVLGDVVVWGARLGADVRF